MGRQGRVVKGLKLQWEDEVGQGGRRSKGSAVCARLRLTVGVRPLTEVIWLLYHWAHNQCFFVPRDVTIWVTSCKTLSDGAPVKHIMMESGQYLCKSEWEEKHITCGKITKIQVI